jgi:C4-dicarboxylate-specific signal transduction histidine kinase
LSTKFTIPGPGGSPAALAGISVDITERKRTEEALQRAHAELESRVEERIRELTVEIAERWRIEAALRAAKEAAETANRAKPEFLAAMSHEP